MLELLHEEASRPRPFGSIEQPCSDRGDPEWYDGPGISSDPLSEAETAPPTRSGEAGDWRLRSEAERRNSKTDDVMEHVLGPRISSSPHFISYSEMPCLSGCLLSPFCSLESSTYCKQTNKRHCLQEMEKEKNQKVVPIERGLRAKRWNMSRKEIVRIQWLRAGVAVPGSLVCSVR